MIGLQEPGVRRLPRSSDDPRSVTGNNNTVSIQICRPLMGLRWMHNRLCGKSEKGCCKNLGSKLRDIRFGVRGGSENDKKPQKISGKYLGHSIDEPRSLDTRFQSSSKFGERRGDFPIRFSGDPTDCDQNHEVHLRRVPLSHRPCWGSSPRLSRH